MKLDEVEIIAAAVTALVAAAAWLQRLRPDREDRIVVRADTVADMTMAIYQAEKARADREEARANRLEEQLAQCRERIRELERNRRDS